jgi:hypothetical protein
LFPALRPKNVFRRTPKRSFVSHPPTAFGIPSAEWG